MTPDEFVDLVMPGVSQTCGDDEQGDCPDWADHTCDDGVAR